MSNLVQGKRGESKMEDQKEKATPNGNSGQPERLWCHCGAELTKTCSKCNSRFSREANYCGNCGTKLPVPTQAKELTLASSGNGEKFMQDYLAKYDI